jgi:hypothetical protein
MLLPRSSALSRYVGPPIVQIGTVDLFYDCGAINGPLFGGYQHGNWPGQTSGISSTWLLSRV